MKPEDTMNENIVTTNCYKISKDEFGIIHREIIKDAHINTDEIKACEEIALAMSGGKKMLTLIDASQFHTKTPGAIEYLKMINSATHLATAIVSNNLSEKITAGYIAQKMENKVEVFPSKERAVKWLLTQKN